MRTLKNFIKDYFKIIILILISLFIISISIYTYYFKPYKIDKNYNKINLDNYNKLMIVAHPDDEILWGGAHLLEDNYLVVCITCGKDKTRVNEFINAMHATNDKYILLGYPDKTNRKRDNWNSSKIDLIKDLTDIINLKDWDLIVTHNPEGEYGHLHHKLTNSFVTDIYKQKDKLYYFGRYHSKKKIHEYYDEMVPIDDVYVKEKKQIIGVYTSQIFIQTSFDHMFNYEDWVSYNEWSELDEKN